LIATGHHQLDSAETMLINLVRGTGIAGFHGIPIKSGNLIRPLSFASQDAIFDFVVANKLAWREDSSNESTKYQRNFIRHEIMPKFQELNAHFEQTLASTSSKIKGIEAKKNCKHLLVNLAHQIPMEIRPSSFQENQPKTPFY
jgi:tRNA(Ile)-lysidine synthase